MEKVYKKAASIAMDVFSGKFYWNTSIEKGLPDASKVCECLRDLNCIAYYREEKYKRGFYMVCLLTKEDKEAVDKFKHIWDGYYIEETALGWVVVFDKKVNWLVPGSSH